MERFAPAALPQNPRAKTNSRSVGVKRREDAQANARAEEVTRANAKAARDPDQVLLVLTRNSATFTARELERHLARHISEWPNATP